MLIIFAFSSVAFAADYGKLKGTITWQYNKFVGTKGDVAAKIYIIPKDFKVDSISVDEEKSYFSFGMTPKNTNLFYAEADGYGNYEVDGIPPGEYYVFIISQSTRRDLTQPLGEYTKSFLAQVARDLDKDGLTFNTKLYKHTIKSIQIRTGITSNVSHDFGNTYI